MNYNFYIIPLFSPMSSIGLNTKQVFSKSLLIGLVFVRRILLQNIMVRKFDICIKNELKKMSNLPFIYLLFCFYINQNKSIRFYMYQSSHLQDQLLESEWLQYYKNLECTVVSQGCFFYWEWSKTLDYSLFIFYLSVTKCTKRIYPYVLGLEMLIPIKINFKEKQS